MSRNLDSTMAGGLSAAVIQPAVFVQITLKSGVEYIWSGIGDFVFGGNTFKGVGDLGSVGPIAEGSSVKADGTSVTLSGIGLSDIDVPGIPTPPTPPTPGPGESVAWSFAQSIAGGPNFFSDPPSIFNSGLGCSGSSEFDVSSGIMQMTNGQSLGTNSIELSWGAFSMPPEIPANAIITRVLPAIVVSVLESGGFEEVDYGNAGGASPFSITGVGNFFGADIGTLGAAFIQAQLQNTLPGAASLAIGLSFVGMAVYYLGSPQTKTSLIYEALNDIRMGAPAKIWYGLMASGALLGTPYLIFKGTVDKPTVRIDEKSSAITIALENRLVNLQRANQRRYTAADQKLAYPDDTAFDWVETLNDIALRWGS